LTYAIEPLGPSHNFDEFDCGNDALSIWLRDHARRATMQGTRTFLLVEEESGRVGGYFSVAPYLVEREDLPAKSGRGAPREIPAVLLAKLAVDRSEQGTGLGRVLMVRALTHIVRTARAAGGKVVVVDAVDKKAASFYEHHNFVPTPRDPLRLVMKLSTAAKELELPWP
jgi:GNAT superfamily N-acetyltransferase